MNVSLYQAAAAMNAHSRWQEVIAENLAASSVPGARKREATFCAVAAGMHGRPAGVASGPNVIPALTATVNFQPGALRATGLPADMALEGPGFFEIQLPDGSRAYTRDGELHLGPQGQLVTKQGHAVLGESGPLQLDPGNPAPLAVAPTGEITQNGEIKGKLRLVEFDQPQLLRPIGDGLLLAGNPQLRAAPASATQVRQGFLEGANISPTVEMASLLTAMRLFEANQKVMQSQDERMGRVISELGTTA